VKFSQVVKRLRNLKFLFPNRWRFGHLRGLCATFVISMHRVHLKPEPARGISSDAGQELLIKTSSSHDNAVYIHHRADNRPRRTDTIEMLYASRIDKYCENPIRSGFRPRLTRAQ
jgi:hypothetical protein